MAEPTLLFGIGATKAGTTWLYDYLRQHSECHLRGVKELHYFDTLDQSLSNPHRRVLQHNRDRLKKKLSVADTETAEMLRLRVRDMDDWLDVGGRQDPRHAAYLSYLANGRGDARLIGDITPCYSTLDRTLFAQMRDLSPKARFVFLLRDPVERAWSHIRMIARRNMRHANQMAARCERVLEQFVAGKRAPIQKRSDYQRTLTELLAVVPRGQVFVAFYENLFSAETLQRLCAFLGISYMPGAFGAVRHAGPELALQPEQGAGLAAALEAQYRFCDTFFDGQLPKRWRTHMQEA